MSQRIEDGGPVHPIPYGHDRNSGITLRDYLAAQVVGAVIASFDKHMPNAASIENFAVHSYRIADAMLSARQRGAQTGGEAHE
ncbi:hypothetical protein [Kaistia adipata]|uniref:hypothetical protein n=1 Tax=Kaistia adipata TaxID=166954 RepID=UPI00056984E0|nr:hypothetical protein [Kaistia adipata]